ncbi:MAG: pilus (MSHA type) biogenesis protein MshL [Pseudomonadota bacterium]
MKKWALNNITGSPLKWLVLSVLAAVLSAGCAQLGPRTTLQTDSADEAIEVMADAVQAEQNPQELEPAPNTAGQAINDPLADSLESLGPSFDLSVDGADAADFFRSLVSDTEFNMVVHPDVVGQVSLQLNNVTVPDVMEIMRNVYGFDYVLYGNVFQVFPDALRTEIYQLNYLNVSRSGNSEMQVSAGKVSDERNDNLVYASGTEQQNQGEGQVVGTIVTTDAEANLWQEVELTLRAMVDEDDGGQVVVTPQVGLIVVKALPKTLHAVASYLHQVEASLTRQVILEAKVIEVTLNEGFEAGIDWHTFGDASGGDFANTEHSVGGEFISGTSEGFNPLGAAFTLNTAFGDFDSTISLLATQGSVQVLSSPRIATVNNQKAVIKVGSDEFFVTDIAFNTVTAGNAININDSPELTPFFSGIALDVTPQISHRDEVILHVHPTVSEVSEQIKQIGGEPVPLAASTIRESDSIVKARSGQIIVIGGLMQNSSTDNNAGVPWLRQIPGVGNLFKQKSQTSIKSELVILLKPMVIAQDLLDDSSQRVRKIRDLMRRRG